MNVKYKEDPREWRKTTWLTALGLAIMSSLLRWRHHLPTKVWLVALIILAAVALAAAVMPRWFRGYYRLSQRLGFYLSMLIGRIALAAFFIIVLTPVGLIRRALGHDPLRLKRPPADSSCWQPAKKATPLERLF